MESTFSLNQWGVIILICLVTLALWYLAGSIRSYQSVKRDREDSAKRSRSSILGGVYEQIAPLLPDFPYHPRDMVFIGKWFDYLVLDGLGEWRLREIVFLEIKSGKSALNANEKMIRETVGKKQVRYEEYRI